MNIFDPIESAEHLFACLHAGLAPRSPDWATGKPYLQIVAEMAAAGRDCTLSNYDRETASAIHIASSYRFYPNLVLTRGVFLPSPKAWDLVTKLNARKGEYECGGFVRYSFSSRKLSMWAFQFPDEAAELRQHVRRAYGPLHLINAASL